MQEPPVDQDPSDVERRELWYLCIGYLVRASDAAPFLDWAKGVDFWGRWMPEPPEMREVFLGEHGWAPASEYYRRPYFGDHGWTQPGVNCPVRVLTVALEYTRGDSGFDCSIDRGYRLHLPATDLVKGLGLRFSGHGADFIDASGQTVAQDLAVHAHGPSALLLREARLTAFLAKEDLAMCWAVLGEKRVLPGGIASGIRHPSVRMSGAYALLDGRVKGFLTRRLADPAHGADGDPLSDLQVLGTETTSCWSPHH